MKNRITVSLPFSFKGKTYSPRATIDLDEHMEQAGIPCLYTHIAEENGISPYSYEHDVMMMSELEFEATEGMVAEFIHDGHFDSDGFEVKWREQRLKQQLRQIALRLPGGVTDENRQALLEAYELGRESLRSEQLIRSTTDPLF